jgi:hypothetical protein
MRDWINGLSGWQLVLFTLGILLAGSIVAALLGAVLVRLGMRRPRLLRAASGLAEATLRLVKRPLTVVVLDEVAAVIQTGHYTKNISDALIENHDELKALVTEKVSEDPNVRLIRRLPGYGTIVGEVTESTLRVLIEMLSDPRTDELINDLLRNNIEQIRNAVRRRDYERIGPQSPADALSAAEAEVAARARRPSSTSVNGYPESRPRSRGGPGAY